MPAAVVVFYKRKKAMKHKFSDVIIKELNRRANEDTIKDEHLYDIPSMALIELVLKYNPEMQKELMAYYEKTEVAKS